MKVNEGTHTQFFDFEALYNKYLTVNLYSQSISFKLSKSHIQF